MLRNVRLAFVATIVWTLTQSLKASGPTTQPTGEIESALRQREYDRALTLVDWSLKEATGAERELLMFERGLALLQLERYAEAVRQFDEQIAAHAEGAWSAKARFRKADALAAMKQFAQAEAIYATEIRRLTGDERKAKLANIYLKFAEEQFAPNDPLVPPNYLKARSFHERALELEPGPALRDEILYKQALCNQKLGSWTEAAEQYDAYLIEFDCAYREAKKPTTGRPAENSAAAPVSAGAPAPDGHHRIDARLGLGHCWLQAGRSLEARRALQDLMALLDAKTLIPDPEAENKPAGTSAQRNRPADQLEPPWVRAAALLAISYQMPTPPDAERLALGVGVLENLIAKAPDSRAAIQAAFDIAAAQQHLGRDDDAIKSYRALIDREKIRPRDDEANRLAERLSQDALFAIGQVYSRQKKYADAIGAWNQYTAKYPTGRQWSAAQQAIVDAEYQIGADAAGEDKFDAARTAWTSFLEKHPLDSRAARIMLDLGALSYREQEKREKAGEAPDWQAPIGQWKRLVSKFPGTEETHEAQYRIGLALEEKIKDLDAAIEAYKEVIVGPWGLTAQQQINTLRSVQLLVMTERVFHTNEKPRLRVDVRNIESLTVKIYALSLEDYFRKSHGLRGVEGLDLSLIDPDRTLTVAVEDYAKYKPIRREIELPMEGPGVWAVTLTNENTKLTADEGITPAKLEATTMVVRSDIDVIIKSSRRQVLVFAQDMLKTQPREAVRVLVSDGRKVFLEGKTGPDGVWQAASDELKNAERLIVLAEQDGHCAGNALGLAGLGFSSGLAPRGYMYTDKTTYLPGESVNIRGVLREVKDGQYIVPSPDGPPTANADRSATPATDPRLRWKLDVIDAKGRVLLTEEPGLGEFGSFATQFSIGEDAPVGDYRLIARRVDGPSFEGRFSVQTYQLARAYLAFEFDHPVVMRGEKIKGAIVAKYHYGEAASGKTIEYQMVLPTGDLINGSGVTDADGKVAIEFDSTALPEEGGVQFAARQADLNIETAGMVFVAVRAFRATIEPARPLYLSEEPVEALVRTKDLSDKPMSSEMTITALLRTASGNVWSETKVDSKTVTTDAKSGEARTQFTLKKGGVYVLRAEGKDRFGHLVSAEATVNVSDDEDATRLRIFSEKQRYKVGETIAVDLHSRIGSSDEKPKADAAERLALITFEGEEVIAYRTMKLRPGHNAVEVPVGHEHFPNFAMGAAVMAGNKFHAASRAFEVERELHVVLKPDRDQYRPRDEMTLSLSVTDQQGKPVAAEIGVAMIDDALLSLYPDTTPAITAFFNEGARRQAELRTETSCTFAYLPQTRPMVTELLAEAERLEERTVGSGFLVTEAAVAGDPSSLAYLGSGDLAVPNSNAPPGSDESQDDLSQVAEGIGQVQSDGRTVMRFQSLTAERAKELIQQLKAGFEPGQTASMQPAPQSPTNREGGLGGGRFLFEDQSASDAVRQEQRKNASLERADKSRVLLGQVNALNKSFALGGMEQTEYEKRCSDLVRQAPPRSYFPEVAYWNPSVTTDADGKAALKIIVPDSSTTWRLVARGVTKETLAGAGEAKIISKHDFVVEAAAPSWIMAGDRFTPRANVHCLTPYTGKIAVSLKVFVEQNGERRELASQQRTVDASGAGVYEATFEAVESPEGGKLILDASAQTQDEVKDAGRALADASSTIVPIRPWGLRLESHAAGVATDSDFVELELPGGQEDLHDLHMTVAVGPNLERWLVEEALEEGPRWIEIERSFSNWRVAPPRTNADVASTLIGCLYAEGYLRSRGSADAIPTAEADVVPTSRSADRVVRASRPSGAQGRLLSERAAGLIAQLLSVQNDDGGWTWCGTKGSSDPWTTASAAWALGKATQTGHSVAAESLEKLKKYLKDQFASSRIGQTELKTVLLHGLSWLEPADFAHANRLYRQRPSLSNAALAHLALVFARLERPSIAGELLSELESRTKETRFGQKTCRRVPGEGSSAWMSSDLELTALALLARLAVEPSHASVQQMADYLAGSARADGWRPHKAKGPVLAALAAYYGRAKIERSAYRLAVRVNGKPVGEATSEQGGSIRIDLDAAQLQPGKQRVDFAFEGRGEYAYAISLSGFAKEFPQPKDVKNRYLRVKDRRILPPPLEYRGRVVNAGFDAAEQFKWFENHTHSLPVGSVATIIIDLARYEASLNDAGDSDYVIVQETIPAGFRLLTDSIEGQHAAYDYSNGLLTLYYGTDRYLGTLKYRMVATTPGAYRPAPTIIRSLYRPDLLHVNKSQDLITVLPRGEKSPDPYRMTPDELYHLARMNFDDGAFAQAGALLKELIAGAWVVREEPYRESVRMLLETALAAQNDEEILNYFEILKEKHPDLVIPFAKIVRVAEAYAKTGQHERAYVIHRATADASFVRDARVGGALQEEGRFLHGMDYLEWLCAEYPDTPQVTSVFYAMSQTVYLKASEAASMRPRDTKDGPPRKVTSAALIGDSLRLLERFLWMYPDSPIADEASYSLLNAYLDLDQFAAVIERSRQMVESYPKSKWLDRFIYADALARFNLGQFDDALKSAQRVVEAEYPDEHGVPRPSPNKWLALYIIGQIHHARGETAKAIEFYKKVKDQFSDASEAIEDFELKRISLPEVSIFHPADGGYREADEWAQALRRGHGRDEALARGVSHHDGSNGSYGANDHDPDGEPPKLYHKPFVTIDYRNVGSVRLQVYRVDLMKLALMEKDLSRITAVNLAGIRPIVEKEVSLGSGVTFVDQNARIELDMPAGSGENDDDASRDGAGAYLVIVRGNEEHASSLVLVTPLSLEVREEPGAQRVRVSVVDAVKRGGMKNVHMKVIGSGMSTFVSGETDLRGVFVADGVAGRPTVLARDSEGRFAFLRGEPVAIALQQREFAKKIEGKSKVDYNANFMNENRQIQLENCGWLNDVVSKQQKGVQVQKAQ